MYFDTVPVAPSCFSDGVQGLGTPDRGPSPFAVATLERVRNALTVPQILPLTRADWAELRATISACRPSPPPRLFPHADLFLDR